VSHQIVLVPVLKQARKPGHASDNNGVTTLPVKNDQPEGHVLRVDREGVARLNRSSRSSRTGRDRAVARIKVVDASRGALRSGLVIVPLVPDLRVNGLRPPGIKIASPGDVVACDQDAWMMVIRFVPELEPIPAEIATRACPTCGVALGEAEQGVRHVCGTWFHCERLDGDPRSPDEVNCYLGATTCPTCQWPLKPGVTWIPDPAAWRFCHAAQISERTGQPPLDQPGKERADERAA
jgi:hypothetical protein